FGNRVRRVRRGSGEFEQALGGASDYFAIPVVEGNFQLAQHDFFDAVDVAGIERIGAVGAQRFESVSEAVGEIIGSAAQVQAELLDVEIPLPFGAGIDPQLF